MGTGKSGYQDNWSNAVELTSNPAVGKNNWSMHKSQVAHQAGAYAGFNSMKWLEVFLLPPPPPLDGMLVHRRVIPSIKFVGTHLLHFFLQLLTIFTKFNASLAELFDYLYLAYSKKDSHEDQWNNQYWSNKHPQEEHEIMPTEELPR